MRSSEGKPQLHDGGSRLSLLASTTLVAALGFTPWVLGAETPWIQLAFRVLGLVALFVVSLGTMRGMLVGSRWAARAAAGALLLIAVSLLSAAISVHRGKSLEAMINLFAIAGLFLAAAFLLRGNRLLRSVALLEVLAAVPVAAFGLAQHFRPDILPPGNPYPGRALGPFGQPNRLGGYLIAIVPVAIALSFAVQDRVLRVALLAAVSCLTLCLVATYSRGAWLGLAAGLVALGVIVASTPGLMPRPALAIAAGVALVLPAVWLAPGIASRLHPAPTTGPAWNLPIDPEREGSGAMRKAIWSGALKAASARPFFGWGIGSFREAYDRSKSPVLKRLEAEGARTADQAHSVYLVTLAERGVLGLAALLVFAGLGLAAGLAALRSASPDLRPLAAGLLASVAALLIHGALEDNLTFAPHGTLLAANLGLLAALPPHRDSRIRARWIGALGILAAVCGLGLSASSAVAATDARAAQAALAAGQVERAMERSTAATRLAPWDDLYWVGRADASVAAARGGRGIEALRDAETSYKSAIALNGSDPVTRHQLARLYLAHTDVFGSQDVTRARLELQAALAQNPYYAEIRNDLGVAFLASGDRPKAVQSFREASEGRREFVDPLLNLAALAIEDGNTAEAKRMVDLALERNPNSPRAAAMRESLATRPGA